jgi:hypothetical protein
LSVADPTNDWFAPSWLRMAGGAQLAMPDSASAQVDVTWTSALFQPAPFGAGSRASVSEGSAVSRRTVTDPVALSPSLLVAVHERVAAAVSVAIVVVSQPLVDAIEVPGELVTVQDTVVGALFQPAAFGVGERLAVTLTLHSGSCAEAAAFAWWPLLSCSDRV